jgi:hypothetical protein
MACVYQMQLHRCESNVVDQGYMCAPGAQLVLLIKTSKFCQHDTTNRKKNPKRSCSRPAATETKSLQL